MSCVAHGLLHCKMRLQGCARADLWQNSALQQCCSASTNVNVNGVVQIRARTQEVKQRVQGFLGIVKTDAEAQARLMECLFKLAQHFSNLASARYDSRHAVDQDKQMHLAPRMNELATAYVKEVKALLAAQSARNGVS